MQKQPPPLVSARLLSTSDGHARWREAALDVYLGHPPTPEEGNDDAADPLFTNSSHDEIEAALISWGIQEPEAFIELLCPSFEISSRRMAITTLFYRHLLQQSHNTSHLPGTTFLEAFLTSCQVDVSTTLFWNEILCLMTMILGAPLALVDRLPELFVVLARVLCWKDRRAGAIGDDESGHDHTESSFHIRLSSQSTLENPVSDTEDASIDPEAPPAKKLVWDRLDASFDRQHALSPPPDKYALLSQLYCIWPCNVLAFLRDPKRYLVDKGLLLSKEGSPWEDVFDRDEVRSQSRDLLRQLTVNPDILFFDAKSELSEANQRKWSKIPSNEIVHRVSILRVLDPPPPQSVFTPSTLKTSLSSLSASRPAHVVGIPSSPDSHTSKPLSSVSAASSKLSIITTTDGSTIPSASSTSKPPTSAISPMSPTSTTSTSPSHTGAHVAVRTGIPIVKRDLVSSVIPKEYHEMVETRAWLQLEGLEKPPKNELEQLRMETLLLRNELMFEVYLKNKFAAHNKRLHHDQVFRAREEAERQSLRDAYKSLGNQVLMLEDRIAQMKTDHAHDTDNHRDKYDRQQERLNNSKNKVAAAVAELEPLKTTLKALTEEKDKQRAELAEVKNQRFKLENELNEAKPKMAAIADFENQIEKLKKLALLAQADAQKVLQQKEIILEREATIIETQQLLAAIQKENEALSKANAAFQAQAPPPPPSPPPSSQDESLPSSRDPSSTSTSSTSPAASPVDTTDPSLPRRTAAYIAYLERTLASQQEKLVQLEDALLEARAEASELRDAQRLDLRHAPPSKAATARRGGLWNDGPNDGNDDLEQSHSRNSRPVDRSSTSSNISRSSGGAGSPRSPTSSSTMLMRDALLHGGVGGAGTGSNSSSGGASGRETPTGGGGGGGGSSSGGGHTSRDASRDRFGSVASAAGGLGRGVIPGPRGGMMGNY